MRNKVGLIIFIFVLGSFSFFIYRYYLKPVIVTPSPAVVIERDFQGFVLGSVDNNGSQTRGLHPCAGDKEEVVEFLNQLISHNQCQKDNLSLQECSSGDAVTLLSEEEINSNFQIDKVDMFYKVEKQSDMYDYYLQSSNNPTYIDPTDNIFYVCDADSFEYINTAYDSAYRRVYYPYEIDTDVLDDFRSFNSEYLNFNEVGIARFSSDFVVRAEEITELANLMYKLGYFSLRGFNTENIVVGRELTETDESILLEDTILSKVYNDTPPFQTNTYEHVYSLNFDKVTRVVTADRVYGY